jgi:glucose-1-phosphate thymidylyltransferase
MKVIIPVAGEGKRLRPFTDVKPKPLLLVAGKPMLDHIMEKILPLEPSEVVFITGYLGHMIQDHVRKYEPATNIRCVEQKVMNGPGAAIWLANDTFDDELLIDYGDTLFDTDLSVIKDCQDDGIIWTYTVDDPSRFGVIVTDNDDYIVRMVEKPKEYVSNLVNIALYYVRNTRLFKEALEHVMRNAVPGKEIYLTEAFTYMIEHGAKLKAVPCPGWFDCGTPEAMLDANETLLADNHKHNHPQNIIIPPVNIHPSAVVNDSIIGPHVSIGPNAVVRQATLSDCIVEMNATVEDIELREAIVGDNMQMRGPPLTKVQ